MREDQNRQESWTLMINEFSEILGYSYARIAHRIKTSPSTIQKLVKYPERRPRDKIFYALSRHYAKVFYGDFKSPKAAQYVEETCSATFKQVVGELAERGLISIGRVFSSEKNDMTSLVERLLGREEEKTMRARVGFNARLSPTMQHFV